MGVGVRVQGGARRVLRLGLLGGRGQLGTMFVLLLWERNSIYRTFGPFPHLRAGPCYTTAKKTSNANSKQFYPQIFRCSGSEWHTPGQGTAKARKSTPEVAPGAVGVGEHDEARYEAGRERWDRDPPHPSSRETTEQKKERKKNTFKKSCNRSERSQHTPPAMSYSCETNNVAFVLNCMVNHQ